MNELDHQRSLCPFVFSASKLDYNSAKDLIASISKLKMNHKVKNFWSLFEIFYGNGKKEKHIEKQLAEVDRWLHSLVKGLIPNKIHPFISALFLNDRNKMLKESKGISAYLPLVFAAPSKLQEEVKSVPSFFSNKSFQFGEHEILGETIWQLLMGDVSGMMSVDVPWELLFALHYWHYVGEADIKAAFQVFANIDLKQTYQNIDKDPIFLLLDFYSKDSKDSRDLVNIASYLPPIDCYLFLKIAQKIFKKIGFQDDPFITAMKTAIFQLMKMKCYKEAIFILNGENYNNDADVDRLARRLASIKTKLTETEEYLIEASKSDEGSEGAITKKEIYRYKGVKARELQEVFPINKSLKIAGRVVDFFLESTKQPDFEVQFFFEALDQAYNVYLQKAMKTGEGLDKLFEWAPKFAEKEEETADYDCLQIYKIFEAIKQAQEGEIVDPNLLKEIATDITHTKRHSFRFKYYVISELINQPNAFELFSESTSAPRDKLLELIKTAYT